MLIQSLRNRTKPNRTMRKTCGAAAGRPRALLLRGGALLTLSLAAVPGPPAPGAAVPGGWLPQDPASLQVHAVAAFAARSLSEEFARLYVVEDIRTAESQVVAGTNYRLSIRIAQLQDDVLGPRKDCTVDVYQPLPPQAADQLTSFDCQTVTEPADATVPM